MWVSYGITRGGGLMGDALMNQGFYMYEWDQDHGRLAKAPNASSLE